MYPFTVSDFPGPECGVLFISIVDLIFGSDMLLFSLLRAINCHYNKEPLKVDCFKYKLFKADWYILPFYSQYPYSEVPELSSFILLQYTHEEVPLLILSIDLVLFSCFYHVLY